MANDFSADANCKALWRFENGALATDSKGTNTLTPVCGAPADLTIKKEGVSSINVRPTDPEHFVITDANLDAGYPFKNADAIKKFSICFFIRANSSPSEGDFRYFNFKYDTNQVCYEIIQRTEGGVKKLCIGHSYSGTTIDEVYNLFEVPIGDIPFNENTWYHVAYVYDDNTRLAKCRFYDYSTFQIYESFWTWPSNIYIGTGILYFSAPWSAYAFDGWMDEIVVFNRILTSKEIDQIRMGKFGSVPGANPKSANLLRKQKLFANPRQKVGMAAQFS